jgi:hypothetical protein
LVGSLHRPTGIGPSHAQTRRRERLGTSRNFLDVRSCENAFVLYYRLAQPAKLLRTPPPNIRILIP